MGQFEEGSCGRIRETYDHQLTTFVGFPALRPGRHLWIMVEIRGWPLVSSNLKVTLGHSQEIMHDSKSNDHECISDYVSIYIYKLCVYIYIYMIM